LTSATGRRRPVRYRRASHLVLYWRRGVLVVRNYATGRAARIDPLVCALLDCCEGWKSLGDIRRTVGSGPLLSRLIERLVDRSVLERSDRRRDPRADAMRALDPWNPEAGFFHTATKDVRFWSVAEATRRAAEIARDSPMPPPVKRYRGASVVHLPRPDRVGEFAGVLLARRTWRRFSAQPIGLGELSTVLGLSAGVQHWVDVGPRELPLKTSPSGGARHPIELYVVVRDVAGLPPGVYHYAADRHALERIGERRTPARLRSYVPGSAYFAKASALVFFTAVLKRQLWRYPYSRAYRASLIEAGHVCQTFCLVGTALKLATFSVMALADSRIESDLRLDGITETVLYAAGLARPPAGSSWAPSPRGQLSIRPNSRLS
jgi:SagB-type dehydrogenase family enzyme